ncbi:hypothetical protein AVEN_260817-1 [Araneus ventricosus]|uniref:Uncharacterized protein n=1 Tax=Araneus ventricosus TaxID=182803 RepID=A0A4Y2FCN6_ARAVE|nr:hypothetical protein AVEN_260817-1 [Araneus ventricosus]
MVGLLISLGQLYSSHKLTFKALDGLKPSEILGDENVKVCNNNDAAADKITPSSPTPQTRLKLATFARIFDRYGVEDRQAAALSPALLHDLSHCSLSLANTSITS